MYSIYCNTGSSYSWTRGLSRYCNTGTGIHIHDVRTGIVHMYTRVACYCNTQTHTHFHFLHIYSSSTRVYYTGTQCIHAYRYGHQEAFPHTRVLRLDKRTYSVHVYTVYSSIVGTLSSASSAYQLPAVLYTDMPYSDRSVCDLWKTRKHYLCTS